MSEEQIRLACIKMALLRGNNPKGTPEERAGIMVAWVAGSEARLSCLTLAVEKFGGQARVGMPALLGEAMKILNFVAPPKPMSSVSARQRGRNRK